MTKTDVLAAASLAVLCFNHAWTVLLNRSEDFFRKAVPTRNLVALSLCVALVAAVIAALRWLTTRNPRVHAWTWWVPWAPVLIPLNVWRRDLGLEMPRSTTTALSVTVGLVLTLLVAIVLRFPRKVEMAVRTGLLLVSPVIVLTFGQAFVLPLIRPRQPQQLPPSEVVQRLQSRLVVLLFDELDQAKTFETRPADVHLDHFDELRQQAIYAPGAHSPALETRLSVSGYLLGRPLSRFTPAGFNRASATEVESRQHFDIGTQPNLFSSVAAAGGRTAVIGWYLPYCRMFSGPSYCAWEQWASFWQETPLPLGTLMLYDFANAAATIPRVRILPRLRAAMQRAQQDNHIASYRRILADASAHVLDSTFNLVYVHLPVPHMPTVFDRRTVGWATTATEDYFSNLVLADRALGELQTAMKAARLWDNTHVLVTGDHGFRRGIMLTEDQQRNTFRRVPFLLKLAGQQQRLDFSPEFDAIVLHDLALMLLQTHGVTPADVVQWLASTARPPGRYERYMGGPGHQSF